MKLEPGVLVHDWRLIERLGAGAFGEVWKAAHFHLPRMAAIKFATKETAAHALGREGVAQFGLEHPGIVRVLDASLSASPPFVVLEYVDGRNLRELLRERGRLEVQDFSSIFRQLAEAIAHAHGKGVVHGDVKPENVIVVEQGVRKIAKLTDFQLGAWMAGDRPPSASGVRPSLETRGPLGTYRYLAPEQELGEPVDGRADLFALGVVLFEMATGTLPQGRDLPSDLNPAVSWWWDHIFSRCYTGRDRRYRDAEELLADIRAAYGGPCWGEMPSQKARGALGAMRTGIARGFAGAGAALPEGGHVAEVPVDTLRDLISGQVGSGARCPRRSRAPVAGALLAAVFALVVPLGVLHLIGSFHGLARARFVCGDPAVERRILEDFQERADALDGAQSFGERLRIEHELEFLKLRASRRGLLIVKNGPDGRYTLVSGRR